MDLLRRERGRGRRVLVYVTHTNLRDVTPRPRSVLEEAGVRVAVLKADTVPAERREDRVAARVREGLDVLVTNPRLVQTGLDYAEFGVAARATGVMLCRIIISGRLSRERLTADVRFTYTAACKQMEIGGSMGADDTPHERAKGSRLPMQRHAAAEADG